MEAAPSIPTVPYYVQGELREIYEECLKRNPKSLEPMLLLKEKLSGLQQKIASNTGQLLCTVARIYDYQTVPEKVTFAGIITPETHFLGFQEDEPEVDSGLSFIRQVKNPCRISKNGFSGVPEIIQNEHDENEIGNFGLFSYNTTPLEFLYFMEKSPIYREPSREGDCRVLSMPIFDGQPRLEAYIGNEEAIPFLQSNLEGDIYLDLSQNIGIELPLNEDVKKSLQEARLEVYKTIVHSLRALEQLEETKGKNITLDGEVILEWAFRPEAQDYRKAREELTSALRRAKERKYDRREVSIRLEHFPGSIQTIDFKEFFSGILEKYAPLLENK